MGVLMNKLVPLFFAVLAPGIVTADDDCRYSAKRTVQASTDGVKQIVVRAGAGSLKIDGEAGGRELSAVGLACAAREGQLDELQLRLDRVGDTLRLTAEIPDSPFRLSNWFGGAQSRIDMTVRLPSGIALDVEDSSGEAEISHVGALTIDDGSGALRLVDINGGLDVKDGSGEVDISEVAGSVRLSDGSGDVSIRTVRGDVVIANDGSGALEIVDVQGNVTIGDDGSGEIRIERVSGSVRIENDGSGGIFVSTVKHDVFIDQDGSGEIEVVDIEGDFEVRESGSGGIRHDRVGGRVRLGGDADRGMDRDRMEDVEDMDVERE
jgi:hypothetical protein